MARPTKFSIAHDKVVSSLKKEKKQFFTVTELYTLFFEKREVWGIASTMTFEDFIKNLTLNKDLEEVKLKFPNKTVINYSLGFGKIPMNSLALSIKKEAYLSHYTALSYHNLTEQIPKTIYVTSERKNRIENESNLVQNAIDIAFSKEQRISNNYAIFNDYTIYLLEGQATNNKGVIEILNNEGYTIRVTDIERTLIDIVVRPNYAGGIYEVLKAYEKAASKISVNRLAAYLSQIKFIYPYGQAIGFYMERSGAYKESQINLLKKQFDFNFYLTYSIKDMEYSEKWRLFYPKGF